MAIVKSVSETEKETVVTKHDSLAASEQQVPTSNFTFGIEFYLVARKLEQQVPASNFSVSNQVGVIAVASGERR